MRIVLFTGKGGVGKTTVASATAVRIAAAGRKTLVMSTDPAHSLADAFGVELGPEPVEIGDGLWAEQIDPQRRLEDNWREIQEHAIALLDWAGVGDVEAEELSVVPGLDEVFSLADVKRHHDEDPYDVLVVDCAPTGETLRLLSLPAVMQWYMERIFPVERRVVGALRPVARRMTALPIPDSGVYAAVQRFYHQLDGVREVLTNPETASVRLVVNPERMVIAEAKRTFTYLNLFGYRVDAVIANRLLPPEVSDPYFDGWKEIQGRHLEEIEASFSPLPVLTARLRDYELQGLQALADLGAELYATSDPSSVLFTGEPMTIARHGRAFALTIALPFARREDLDLGRKGDELLVRVGRWRRTIMLPRVLSAREVTSARLDGDRVEIIFDEESTS